MKRRYWSILILLFASIFFSVYAQENSTPPPRTIFVTNTPQPRFVEHYRISLADGLTVQNVNWSPGGDYLIINNYRVQNESLPLQLWDATTGTYLRDLNGTPIWFDDEYYWVFEDVGNNRSRLRDMYFVSARTGEVIYTLNDVQGQVRLNPVRTQLSMGYRLGGRIYDVRTGEILRQTGSQVSWSPDGTYTVNETGGTIYVASAETGEILYQLAGHQLSRPLNWSPDNSRLIVEPLGDWGYILDPFRVWTFPNRLSDMIYDTSVAKVWSPDSSRIAAVMDFLKLRIWDATTGALLQTFNDHQYPAFPAEWTEDGRYILLNNGDYRNFGLSYVIYDLESGELALDVFQDLGSRYRLSGLQLDILEDLSGFRRYDVSTGELVLEHRFEGTGVVRFHTNWQWGATPYFIGNEDDSLIAIYSVSQNRVFQTIETPFDEVFNLVWHPTQNILAVTGLTNEVIVYRLEG